MKNNKFLLNTLLAAVLLVAFGVLVAMRTASAAVVLPRLNIPNMVLLSLAALLAEHFLSPGNPRCYPAVFLLGAVSFGLLPLAAGLAGMDTFWKYGLIGGVVFGVTTFLFTSMTRRLATGEKAPGALLVGALGIWLASQCFTGILL